MKSIYHLELTHHFKIFEILLRSEYSKLNKMINSNGVVRTYFRLYFTELNFVLKNFSNKITKKKSQKNK